MNEARYRAAERKLWESCGATPTEQEVRLDRIGVAVRVQEVGAGPPVVLVHGASNSGSSWAPLVARLDGYRCVMLDRPGCGLSQPLADSFDDVNRLGDFADGLIADVLDVLDLDRAHVIGTSFGGYIALRGAAANPDRIDRTAILGWSVGAPIARTPLVMRLASVRALGLLLTRMPPSKAMARAIFKQIGLRDALASGRITPEMIDWFQAMLRDTDTMRNELKAGPRILTPLRGLNVDALLSDELLGSIRTPVHFLWGEQDPFGGADTARAFAALVPNSDLEMMRGGHAVWLDDPDHAAKAVRSFLEGQ